MTPTFDEFMRGIEREQARRKLARLRYELEVRADRATKEYFKEQKTKTIRYKTKRQKQGRGGRT